jgi:octaprenyl-diphosphate synthase
VALDRIVIMRIESDLTSVNAFDYTRKQAQKSASLAKKSLDSLQDSKYKEALILLCDLSLQRKS